MLNVFVCEDNNTQKEQITKCIENYILMENLDMNIAVSSVSPYDIIEYVKNNQGVGLYFFDVSLNCDINGIVLAQKIREYDPRGFIVFITTHSESLQLTFKYKVEALDYILKDDIAAISSRICECIDNAYTKYTSRTSELQNIFTFKGAEKKLITLDCTRILYFEASPIQPRKVIVYSENSMYDFYAKLNAIQKTLSKNFFRCHKSFIVNANQIASIDLTENIILLENGSTCPVSVRQIKPLKKLIHANQDLSFKLL